MTKTVREIATIIKGEVVGDAAAQIRGVGTIESAKEGQVAFAFSREHLQKLEETGASCVVVPQEFNIPSKKTLIKAPNPKEAFIGLLTLLHKPGRPASGIHEKAVVSKSAKLGKNACIGAGTVIGDNVNIGDNALIYANVTIYHDCVIGNNVILHSGTVIGSDGFGFVEKGGIRHKIPQVGKVIIEDDVEIGSNCSIDRATIGETVIGKGTKLDNLIQVAHNVRIGKNVVIAGQSGIAGSTVIEDNVTIAAQVGIKDHIRIGKGAIIAAKSAVKDSIEPGKIVGGIPAKDGRVFARELAAVSKLTKNINKIFRLIKSE